MICTAKSKREHFPNQHECYYAYDHLIHKPTYFYDIIEYRLYSRTVRELRAYISIKRSSYDHA